MPPPSFLFPRVLVSRHSFGEKQSAQQNLERFAKQQRNNAKAQVFSALRSQKKRAGTVRPFRNGRVARRLRFDPRSGSLAMAQRVDTPGTRACKDEIEKDEAVNRGELAAVQHRIKASARMHHEIGDRGEAAEDEGDRPREQADREQDAADELNHAADTGERRELDIGEIGNDGKAEDFPGAVLQQAQADIDAQEAENSE